MFLYSPQIAKAYNGWLDAETEHSTLSPRIRQIIILTVGVAWEAAYEIYAHEAVAQKSGLEDRVIAQIIAGREPDELTEAAKVAYRFSQSLAGSRSVDHSLYDQAVAAFGERGTVDMVQLIGLYLATSAMLNAFKVPAP